MAKNELYGNWRVLAPDGELLFLALEKRINWYLSRNLAEKVDENTIRLTFEPKSRTNSKDLYIVTEKLNKCVVCGSEELETLTKHHIVPLEYRKLFPEKLKSRNSHDIVAICRDCHDIYEEEHATNLRYELAQRYNAPIYKGPIYNDILRSVSIGNVIICHQDGLPKDRFDILIGKFSDLTKIIKPTIEDISNYIDKYKDYRPLTHAEIVMNKVNENNELFEFIKMWRQNFIEVMNPQYMPIHWSVDRKIYG